MRQGREGTESGTRAQNVRIIHPVTGHELSIPFHVAVQSTSKIFHPDRILFDVSTLCSSMLQEADELWTAFPACRLATLAIFIITLCHGVPIAFMQVFFRATPLYAEAALNAPAMALKVFFVLRLFHWNQLSHESKR